MLISVATQFNTKVIDGDEENIPPTFRCASGHDHDSKKKCEDQDLAMKSISHNAQMYQLIQAPSALRASSCFFVLLRASSRSHVSRATRTSRFARGWAELSKSAKAFTFLTNAFE